MANYEIRNRVMRQRVYTLHMPSNAVEVEKMLQGAYQDCNRMHKKSGGVFDDTIRVESDDEAIYFVFDIPDGAKLTEDAEENPAKRPAEKPEENPEKTQGTKDKEN